MKWYFLLIILLFTSFGETTLGNDIFPIRESEILKSITHAQSTLKIFVYTPPPGTSFLNFRALKCPLHFHSEKTVPSYFGNSAMRTTSPEEADVFFIDNELACFMWYQNLPEQTLPGREYMHAVLWEKHLGPILHNVQTKYEKYWMRYGGRDHVFLWGRGEGPFCEGNLPPDLSKAAKKTLSNVTFLLNNGIDSSNAAFYKRCLQPVGGELP